MYIATLDAIHHQGLRLALGTFRTSPVKSLYVEANEPWLNLRRKKLAMQYFLKLRSNPLILTHTCFQPFIQGIIFKEGTDSTAFWYLLRPRSRKAKPNITT